MTSLDSLDDQSLDAFDPATRKLVMQQRAQNLGDTGAASLPLAPGVQNALVDAQDNPGRLNLPASAAPDYALAKKVLAGNAFPPSPQDAAGNEPGEQSQAGVAQGFRQLPSGGETNPSATSSPTPTPQTPVMVTAPGQQQPGMMPGAGTGGGGGGGYGIGAVQKMATQSADEARRATGAAYDKQEQAIKDASELGEQKAAEQASYMRRQNAEIAKADAQNAEHEQIRQAAVADHQAKMQRLTDEAGDGKIDYNRMFKNEDGSTNYGSTVLATLAVAFGALGQAMTGQGQNGALQIINDKINRDVAEQKDAYQKKKDKIGAEDNLWATTREQFHDDRAAEAAARNMLIDQHQRELAQLNTEYAAPEKRVAMQQAQAGLEMEKAKNNQIIDQSAIANANQGIAQRMQSEQLGISRDSALMQRMAMLQKAQAGGEKLPAAQAQALADLQTAQKLTQGLRDKPNQVSSFFSKFVPGTTSADEYNRRANTLGQMVGTSLEGGKLTDADFENKYKPLVPRATDSEATKNKKLADLDKLLSEKGKSLADIFGQQGYAIPKTEGQIASAQDSALAAL